MRQDFQEHDMTNSLDTLSPIRIFIGEPLQHRSDYECVTEVCRVLTQTGQWAFVFANFHLAGRQVDVVVFTEEATFVIEAKCYSHPVSGGTNGPWEQLGPYGTRRIRNAYEQAWNARNALRDEIQRAFQIDGYPNGLVIITPEIPSGSRLASNFKVVIAGLDQTGQELQRPSGALLTQAQCETLAMRLRLEQIGSIGAALDEEVLIAERAYKSYTDAFSEFHCPVAAALIDDEYSIGETKFGLAEVLSFP
jgi:hypothetical protein